MDVDDDKDGFGPIRTSRPTPVPAEVTPGVQKTADAASIVSIAVEILAIAPLLQSSTDDLTRDKELTELLLGSATDWFLILLAPLLTQVKRRRFYLSSVTLSKILRRLDEEVLRAYEFSHMEAMHLLCVQLLSATMPQWLNSDAGNSDVRTNMLELIFHYSKQLESHHIHSWRVRDALLRFFGSYLSADPTQSFCLEAVLSGEENDRPAAELLPDQRIVKANSDQDMRVRFTAAVCSSILLTNEYLVDREHLEVYDAIIDKLCASTDEYVPCVYCGTS